MDFFSDAHDPHQKSVKRSWPLRYGVTVLCVLLALLLTLHAPAIRNGTPFLFFFLAVTVSTWYGGRATGFWATGLAALGIVYWVLPPYQSLQIAPLQLVQMAGFLAVAGAIAGCISALQQEKNRVATQRETLRLTLASIGDAVIVTDPQANVRWMNEVAATLTGWPVTAAQGRSLAEVFPIIHEQTRQPIEHPVHRVLRENRVSSLANHTILVSKEGVERAIEDSAAPIRDQGGQMRGVILVFHDITERQRAETVIRESEARFRAIFESNMLGIGLWEEDGALSAANATLLQLLGYSQNDLADHKILWKDLTAPESQANEIKAIEEVRRFGRCTPYEKKFVRKDGQQVPTLVGGAILEPEGRKGVFFAVDMTERKQAEAELRASEAKLTKIFNASPLVITITALADGRLLEVNDSFIQLTGYTRDEVIGRTPIEIGLWVEPAQRAIGLARLQTDNFQRNSEFRFQMKDGSERICLTSAELLKLNGQTCVLTVLNDITERKEAEVARQAAEERFTKAFQTSPQAMCINRVTDGRYIDANTSFARLVDYPLAEIIGRTSFDVGIWTNPQARAITKQTIIEQGSNRDFEHRFYTSKGELRDIVAAGVVIEVEGEPCILSVVNDVTARKQAEEALRESEARFRATFEQAAVGMAQVSPEGHYLRVNQRLCEITGYCRERLLQKRYQEITHPDDLALNIAQVARLLAGEVASYTNEVRYHCQDGSFLWVNLTESVVRDELGRVKYRVAVMEDISARKAAEARLLFLAETSAVLASSLDDAVTLQRVAALMVPQLADLCTVELLGADNLITPVAMAHVNPAKLTWLQQLRALYPPQYTDAFGIGQVLRTGRSASYPTILEERLLAVASDQTYHTLLQQIGFKSVLIVPLQVRDQVLGALTLAWSDTDRHYNEADLHLAEEVAKRAALAVDNARLYQVVRAAESELRLLNESLEQRVAARTAELQRSNHELDQFAYVASHDLKAPLRAIDQIASWITQDAAELLPAHSQSHLAKLRGRVQRMEKLLEDLLVYSRAGRQHHPPEEVDTDELTRNVIDLLALPPGFTIRIAENLPTFVTERVPLETILRNLISNALKHHHHPETGQVTVSATAQATGVAFTITDDGPGIDPRYHERIFQMFQTLKPRDQVEGSGMGLAIVKKLVESYGGSIQVISSAGQGATFRFTWPALD
ncbi:MAG: PAS domain S-box protein [Chloroflexi bacterium]|nr:PAS domain S-box protein [Chloroflexota bacterium]